MPVSVDEKIIMKAYLSRKIRTLPFLVIMLLSLLPLSTLSFEWVRGQLAWHKTIAEVVMVTDDGGAYYNYTIEKTGETFDGILQPYRVLIYYSIGKPPKVHDTFEMAYNIKDPRERIIFHRVEMQMLTWAIVFVFCFVIYFWLEWDIKKRSNIRIAG